MRKGKMVYNHLMSSGIYKILNLLNGKTYIGKSSNINKRWSKHRKLLREDKHTNTHLQNAYNKYGIDNLKLEVIELCSEEILNEREIYWINLFKSTNNKFGYNKVGGGNGGRLNPESIAKMTASMRGKKQTQDNKDKIRRAILGIPRSQEVKDKISKSKTGEIKSADHKKKISKTLKGRKMSSETKLKMSKARKGIKQARVACPHCNKIGGTAMHRWHFDNCRNKCD